MLYSNPLIENLLCKSGETIVFTQQDRQINFKTLQLMSAGLAVHLKEMGVNRREKVVALVAPDVQFVVLFFALLMLDVEIVLIDPQMGKDNFIEKYKQIDPKYVFIDSRIAFLSQHPILRFVLKKAGFYIPFWQPCNEAQIITVGQWLPTLGKHQHIRPTQFIIDRLPTFTSVTAHLPCLITYTSGTLASPKGVRHTYQSLTNAIEQLSIILKKDGIQRIATHLQQYILLAILADIQVFLWKEKMTTNQRFQFIGKHKITTLFGTPSDFVDWISHSYNFPSAKKQLSSIQQIYMGSAPVYRDFLETFTQCFEWIDTTVLYGMTEHLMVSHISAKEKLQYKAPGDVVGYPFDGVAVKIIENEVCVDSPQLFDEYYQMGKAPRPFKTGDLGCIQDGKIVLLGRKKDMIIRGNFNIYPTLYEETILRIPEIKNAAMVGIYDHQKADESVVLCVELSEETYLSDKQLLHHLSEGEFSIDLQALPDEIVRMKIPVSGRHHKVDKKKIRDFILKRKQSIISI